MKRTWKFLALIITLAFLLTLGVSGALAQLPVVPGITPLKSKFVSGEVLVKFHGAPPGKSHGSLRGAQALEYADFLPARARFALEEIRGKAVRAFPQLGVLQVKLPSDLPVQEALEMLKQSGAVEHAEPNFLFFAYRKPSKPPAPVPVPQALPNDEFFYLQWALDNTGQTIYQDWFLRVYGTKDADIDAPEAWAIRTDGSDTLVVLIDTGVDYNHPDLAANMWVNEAEAYGMSGFDDDENGYKDDIHGINAITGSGDPMDDQGHGTHCAGIIGAEGDNGIGVSGVNWKAQIMALKFLNEEGSGSEADAIECIEYALNVKQQKPYPRMVMSNSWGAYLKPEDQEAPVFLENAISLAGQAGVIFVAAAGNDGVNIDVHSFYPAGYALNNIITVGASDEDDKVSFYNFASNYGAKSVDLFAPGTWIASTYLTTSFYGPYVYLDGTSMAAPHVSGAAALVWSQSPTADYTTIKSFILNNVDKKKQAFFKKCVTGGRLNLYNALKAASQ
jgi:subtilisin family serine protease